jgi:EmrB/QacA subfamily drug resistance transporter
MAHQLRTPAPARTDRRTTALVVIALAQLMVALDATVVNVALPTVQAHLGFSDVDRQWVVTAYTLPFAGLLLLGGRVADQLGRRRAFLLGLTGFAAASALAGAAPGFGLLVTGRALQGAFAAILAPTALSLVAVTFTEPHERARAFGVYGAVASAGGASGLLLGGALTEYLTWRWCLYVNVLIAAVSFVAGRRVLPVTPRQTGRRLDLVSGALATCGLAAVVLACSQSVGHGWRSGEVLVPLVVAAVALVGFVVRQATTADPLLPLSIVADRARASAYAAVAAAVVGTFGMFLMLTYYLQAVRGFSPMQTGIAFLPLTVTVSASAYGIASRFLPKVAPRLLVVPGLLVAASGLWLLAQVGPDSGYGTVVLPAELLVGLGIGCVFTPSISVATSGVDPRSAGVAAAVANTAMQVGGSVGTAVLNTIAVTVTAAYLAVHGTDHVATTAGLVHGYAAATGWAALLLTVTAAAVALFMRDSRALTRVGTTIAEAHSRKEESGC